MKLLKPTLLLISLLLLASCGRRPIGYGVLLWAPSDSELPNGQLLEITEESRLNDTYTVTTAELEEDGTLPMWRVAFFEEQEAAMEYANQYAPYADTFARAQRQALPVREERSRQSSDVYRLRENELMKVLHRTEEPSNEGGLEGHWYRVLTREGVQGWAFGYYLEITGGASEDDGEEEVDEELSDVERILSNSWRPEYFREMIDRERVDLDRFHPRYGLFPDPENQEIELVLPEHSVTYPYEEFYRAAPSRYGLEGSPVTISIRGEDRISVQYTVNGRERSRTFILLEREIPEIIEDELARRRELWKQFTEPGNLLVSTAYGEIELLEEARFSWTGFDRLTPTVIPSRAEESGTVSFPLFLSDNLREEYDGAVLFTFESESDPVEVRFIYEQTASGVRLTYVPADDVKENIVQREAFSPIVIFFSYENS
ncbi:MAG: SH3 domain-containing protein [Alkalispirochaetaceae bacterium]